MKTINQSVSSISLAACLGSSLLLGACSFSPSPSYYSLASNFKSLPSEKVRVIELLPVGLPDRLDRTQIVIQDASGQSNVLDLRRWTSTLSSELRDGLSSQLQQRLGAVDRYHSGATSQSAYRIAADFSHFDGLSAAQREGGGSVYVAVTWTISRVDDPLNPSKTTPPKPIACRMAFNTPLNPSVKDEVNSMVDASRQSLSRVAVAITTSVLSLEGGVKNTDAVCG